MFAALLNAADGTAGVITNQASASFIDGSSKPHTALSNVDSLTTAQAVNVAVSKSFSAADTAAGPGPYTVSLSYSNAGSASAVNVVITDPLPAGLVYVAGSGRWSVTGNLALSDAVGSPDDQGAAPNTIRYDYAVSAPSTVTAALAQVPAGGSGSLSFQVMVTASMSGPINNTAAFRYDDGGMTLGGSSNTAVLNALASVPTATLTVSSPIVAPLGTLTYRLTGSNAGATNSMPAAIIVDGLAAAGILLRDVLPSGTTFSAWGALQPGSVALYHLSGAAPQSYVSGAPAALSTVDAVALLVPALAAGAQFSASFSVTVDGSDTQNGAVQISNTGAIVYATGSMPLASSPTNTVVTMVTTSNGSIQFFGPGYKNSQSQAAIGTLLYIQATAPACDSNPTVRELVKVELADTSGDRETFTSTETGPNSGVYQVAPILTSLGTVVVGDGVVEAAGGDTLTVEITSCGAKVTASIILIDPSGVVFDSHSNLPLANAAVSLVVATPNACTTTPATVSQSVDGVIQPASSTYVTDATGAYHFPLVPPGNYCLTAVPPPAYAFPSTVSAANQPAGRRVISTSPTSGPSYGGVFAVTAATGSVSVDLPMDARALTGLFVQKTPSKSIAEVGDFVDYTVSIANNTGVALAAAGNLADALPAGFTYVPGSARLNSTVMPDPQGGRGPMLTFHLPALAVASTTLLTYRVQLGSAAIRGDGVNRAQVRIAATVSNLASATVRVEGGVFSDDAFILGKVFLDCNDNQRQDDGEMGIPGVRLYLEDGTNVVTDSEGKYSLYGITAKTHVLKLDRTTLPRDAQLEILSNRNAGDAGSVFADLRNGELHRSDFAVSSCNLKTIDIVSARRKQSEKQASGAAEKLLAAHLDADSSVKPLSDVRGLPASGVVGTAAPVAQSAGSVPLQPVRDIGGFNSLSNDVAKAAPAVTGLPLPQVQVAAPPDLESLLPQLDNQLGFIGLKDHDTLPIAQTNVRIKGTAGSSFVLSVNGEIISDAHVGKKSVLSEKSLQAWEYFGVDLHPGSNHLQVSQIDQFGNARGQAAIDVIAPDKLGKIETLVVQESVADGHGAARILVRLTDAKGTPVTVRTSLTLEATLGSWDVEDLDPREPGVQVFIEGGSREFKLLAPQEPGESAIRVSAGSLQGTAHVTFLPDLRPLIASGLLEGVLNLRSFNTNALTPAQRQDGFEQQLTNLSLNWNTGKEEAAARAAIFLKGKIRGDYLLTLGYDSDKDTQTRLFRDIQPDQFYPVYGDSSVRGFDAQSTSRLYVRIDKGRSWLLYGDFTTQASSDARQLSNYNRSLTGVKEHYETRRLIVNGFASSDSTTQVIDEIKADGTSGPFMLSTPNMVENSERVEVLVRDRNQPALIILVTQLQRFVDYELEPLTGTLLLKAPIATFDPGFNPQSIRITYEVDQAGKKFWVVGADAQYKLNNRLEVGGVFVDDRNPANPGKLEGVNSTLKLGQKTFLTTEVAQTDSAQIGAGTGERVELKHDDGALQARLYADKTDLTFDNPSSSVTPGHTEAGGRVVYKLSDTVSLRGEAVHSEDQATTGQLNGAFVSAEKRLKHGIKVEIGARKAHQNEQGAAAAAAGTPAMTTTNTSTLPPPAVAASGVAPTVPPVDLESLRIKISAPLPYVPKAGIYGEYEQDVRDSDKKLAALGGEYQIATRARVYFHDEVISSLSGPDSLNSVQKQNATVFGVDSDYMKDGRVFSEYRIRDAYSGGEAEAAIGLRNRWPVAPGLTLTTTAERVHTLSGIATEEATAGSLGVDYTANAAWKSSGRIEIRNATDSDSVLVTLGSALKIDADWTALTREALADSRLTGDASGDRKQERLQAGVAFRDTRTNSWSALGLLEHRYEVDTTQPTALLRERTEILSLSGNLQMGVPSVLTLRLAGKWVTDDSNGLPSFAATQLLSARYTRDLTRRWDLGITASTLFNGSLNSHELGLGFEGGYNLAANLWLSAGYNIFGYREDVLSGGDYSNSGVYLRIRFKFDENLLAEATGGFNKPITRPVTGTPP
jgi:uncharacterized repeat protein (TIGR01451 family)